MKGDVTYTPAFPTAFVRKRRYWWWKRGESLLFHSSLLVSAGLFIDKVNFREKCEIGKDVLVVGDSGGFQILKGVKEFLEPVRILRWQERNVDVGITLDVPPLNPKNLGPLNDIERFRKCARMSARFNEIMERNRETNDLILLKVLQGGVKKELEIWYNETKKQKFDGYALSIKPPNDPMQVALHTTFIHEKEAPERVHIFLGSGFDVIPTIIYASQLFRHVTFDSSSPFTLGMNYRWYLTPTFPKFKIRIAPIKGVVPKLKNLPCDCPVCTTHNCSDFVENGPLIALHNLYVFLTYISFVKSLLQDREVFLDFVERFCSERTKKSIEFIDMYMEGKEFTKCYDAFKSYFQYGNGRSGSGSREGVVVRQTKL